MTKKIFFVAASDRLNYGDLLFPIIFKSICNDHQDISFHNYGIISSDLAAFGALPTDSYKVLLSDIKVNGGNLVIGGGEVLFPSWRVLYSFINPFYAKLVRSHKIRMLDEKVKFSRFLLSNGKVNTPFSPSRKELATPSVRVFYNSVGGRFDDSGDDDDNQILKNTLLEAQYISVRDKRTKESLLKHNVPCVLSPDSALVMADIFPVNDLRCKISFDFNAIPKKYIFLQLGINKAPKDVELFSKHLTEQLDILGCELMLCPIGKAPGHEDHVILSKLASFSDRFHLIEPENIYDIMFLIAKSCAYAGTSLHGMITAQSFGVPFVPLNKSISKLDSYCKTWASGVSKGCIDFSEIHLLSELIRQWDFKKMEAYTIHQKKEVYLNFDKILGDLL